MSYLKLEKSKLDTLIAKETKLRDDSPEYTLDWYTYDNRVKLLEEVVEATTPLKEEPKVKKEAKPKTAVPTKQVSDSEETKEEK